jgi:uncharacterized protein YndB with AHSA1/START domain
MNLTNPPVAKASLLIRKPVAEVFEAFVDPQIITNFWFDESSGRLEAGTTVNWRWAMFDMTVDVDVIDIKVNERIEIKWGTNADDVSAVEWTFEQRSADTTFVRVVNKGFSGDADKIVGAALDSTGGFALVLAAAKAWLEHGVRLNVVADGF